MKLQDLLKARWFATLGSSIAIYLPVIAGIISPMIWPLLYASPVLYYLLYWWWTPLAQFFGPQWYFVTSYISNTSSFDEFALFPILVGTAILLVGLVQIARIKVKNAGLATTGLYKYSRHPQHLGITILSFGILMLNPIGIRIGDLIAWTLVVFLYVALADGEEIHLENEFGGSYVTYKSKTCFMIPFLPSVYDRLSKRLPSDSWRRKIALFMMYLAIVSVLILVLMNVPAYHTR